MATLSIKIVVERSLAARVLEGFRAQLDLTRRHQGCSSCYVEHDLLQTGSIQFHSLWDAQTDLDNFLCSQIMDDFLQLVELSLDQPVILINNQRGNPLLRKIRNGKVPFGWVTE